MDFNQWLGTWRPYLIPGMPLLSCCTTNNHAIEMIPEVESIVASHIESKPMVSCARGRRESARRAAEPPNPKHRFANGATLHRRGITTRSKLLRRRRQYIRLYRRATRAVPTWAFPCVARMADLMSRLEVR
jgi:hypothetical protein